MIQVRKSEDRAHARRGWLESYHTFSFAQYYDPRFSGFRDLLVINEDYVQPDNGFGKHPHENMEIITYMVDGEIAHKDSQGGASVIRGGDVQRMSAGRGIIHSEINPSSQSTAHLLQIWITPKVEDVKPSYEEKHFGPEDKKNRLKLIVSPTGEDGALTINQDAKLYSTVLDPGLTLDYNFEKDRHGWIQVVRGSIELNGELLHAGDGAAISREESLRLTARDQAEALLFDLS
jgi:redox-sensitive bicupin YhaK (pirin superfamily)